MSARCAVAPELRARLREATHNQHQSLDKALGQLDLAERNDYARFLRVQADARVGVEQWLVRNAPRDWLPPSQASLLARDLEWLGSAPDENSPVRFEEPDTASGSWLGVAWVLAGSSLGNRMMERDLAARAPDHWPMAFLRDDAMPAYFKALRPLLQTTRSNPGAERSASAVFAHFTATADRQLAGAMA